MPLHDTVLHWDADAPSVEDARMYTQVIQDAVGVHETREEKRHGLWKTVGVEEQTHMIKAKADRIAQMLKHADQMTPESLLHEVEEELLDIINYAVFGIRCAVKIIGEPVK